MQKCSFHIVGLNHAALPQISASWTEIFP